MDMLRLIRRGRSVMLRAPIGTFSYYHPKELFTGYSWDCQTAALLLSQLPIRSILILGLGGGTVARQCRALFPEASIIGVDVDRCVIELGIEHCQLAETGVEIHVMPGSLFLKRTRRRFCAILDDMWPPQPSGAKPLFTEPGWPQLVRARLKPGGIYVVNLYSRSAHPAEVPTAIMQLRPHFTQLREVRPGLGPTSVLAAGSDLRTPRQARARVLKLPAGWATGLGHISFLNVSDSTREV